MVGTNYYLHIDICSHCGHSAEVKHIGKSSSGWSFCFRAYEIGPPLRSWKAWQTYLKCVLHPEYVLRCEIRSEDDTAIGLNLLTRIVTRVKPLAAPASAVFLSEDHFIDEDGYSFYSVDFS